MIHLCKDVDEDVGAMSTHSDSVPLSTADSPQKLSQASDGESQAFGYEDSINSDNS